MGTGLGQSQGGKEVASLTISPYPVSSNEKEQPKSFHQFPGKCPGVCSGAVREGARGLSRSSGHHLALMTCHLSVQHSSSSNSGSLFDLVPRALQPSSGMSPWPSLNSTPVS